MKAVVCTKYGSPEVLKLQDVEKPTPLGNEILIKINHTTVTSSDCIIRGFNLPKWHPARIAMGFVLGFGKPKSPVLGMVASGEVEAVGDAVTKFQIGEEVVAYTVKSATKMKFGTYAEYITVPEDWMIFSKPSNVSSEEAVAIPYGGSIALHFLKKGNIQNCKNILIVGASGTVGSTAVQLAKYYGAKVTGVCSTSNVELVQSLGADRVIDYTKEDYSGIDEQFDLILYAVPLPASNKKGKSEFNPLLAPTGKFVSIHNGSPTPNMPDLLFLKELSESGDFKPVLGRTYSLEQMAEAHEYVETGHKTGNVIVRVN